MGQREDSQRAKSTSAPGGDLLTSCHIMETTPDRGENGRMPDPAPGTIVISTSALRHAAAALVAAAVLIAAALLLAPVVARELSSPGSLPSNINQHEYQAVFLVNGQVYFGKLTGADSRYYYLRHVYFLQSGSTSRTTGATQQVLIKLTKEIHGPEDLLVINQQQVLYIENLSPSGCAAHLLSGEPCR